MAIQATKSTDDFKSSDKKHPPAIKSETQQTAISGIFQTLLGLGAKAKEEVASLARQLTGYSYLSYSDSGDLDSEPSFNASISAVSKSDLRVLSTGINIYNSKYQRGIVLNGSRDNPSSSLHWNCDFFGLNGAKEYKVRIINNKEIADLDTVKETFIENITKNAIVPTIDRALSLKIDKYFSQLRHSTSQTVLPPEKLSYQ